MDFGLSEEQQLLLATVSRFVSEELSIERVRELVAKQPGHDGGAWQGLAELGVAGILVPEEHGGGGLSMLDAAVAAQALARGVAPAPFLGTAVMAATAIRTAGSREQQARWLPRIASGALRMGVAAGELVSRRGDAGVFARGDRLHGLALMAIDALDADVLLVAAGSSGEDLALVEANARGLVRTPLKTIDRTRGFAELALDGAAPVEWLGPRGGAAAASRRMLDAGRAVLAADLLGAAERAIELAVAYAMQREQFGRKIASFQAVKHLCAEMVAELEPARSLVWYAAHAFDAQEADSSLVISHAKAHLSEISQRIVRTATEVHGGIGFTDEQNLHFWFKRVGVDRQLLGSPEQLREHAARLQGWSQAAGGRAQ
jgi:alkylation response protein AidB-like acyl-CoA dehydrogenase